nr:chromosome segregation protein SMC [Sediminivirga luteola]
MKTLTLRGFKSFASATTLHFEPGVTCVVGPNGSGKSNVVDALAWVMGEQGAKSLRGGKMEDVIFAGTTTRPALGRAEVSLTIDNSDGALPIEYTEVTISRTLFRSGGSEYAINGQQARLLDVQELLSDSGLGREMHVIVGQGQLDAVLRATPEDRRGFIEEAAGVLKHRRRKEKAQRKLTGMQANLDRLSDLTAEVAKQLGPLGRQAEAARRAQTVQRDLRDAQARLLADDLAQLQASIDAEADSHSGLKAELAQVEEERRRLEGELNVNAELLTACSRDVDAARELCFQLSASHQKALALARRAGERSALLDQQGEDQTGVGRSPEELEAQAERLGEEVAEQEGHVAELSARREQAAQAKQAAEEAYRAEDRRIAELTRAAADRREHLATLAGKVSTAASRVEAAEAELTRQREQLTAARERRERFQTEFTAAEQEAASVDVGEEDLDAAHEAALARQETADAALAEAEKAHREALASRTALQSRLEALRLGLERSDAAAELIEAGAPGVRGRLADHIAVEPGYEDAVTVALGGNAEGLLVESADAAAEVLALAREQDAGSLALSYPPLRPAQAAGAAGPEDLPPGARPAAGLVRGEDAGVAALLETLLAEVVIADQAGPAELALLERGLTVVTTAGERFGPAQASLRQHGGELLQLHSAVEETQGELERLERRIQRMAFELGPLRHAAQTAVDEVEETLAALHESDARITATVEHLGQLGQNVRAAAAEAERIETLIARTEEELERHRAQHVKAQQDLREAESGETVDLSDPAERDRLAAEAQTAAEALMDATLALRAAQDQLDFTRKRQTGLQDTARRERRAREEAARRREARKAAACRAAAVARLAEQAAEVAAALESQGVAMREKAVARLEQLKEGQTELGTRMNEVQERHGTLTQAVHRDEVAREQLHAKYESAAERAMEKLSLTPEALLEGYGPHLPVPDPGDPDAPGKPYVRAEQEKRLRQAEKTLARMGQINPLALEEFAALEERHRYLETQLADLKKSRADLIGIMRDVDRHVEEIFTAAYHDTAREFGKVFPVLFPGGEGKLVLTDPEDMLTTGIEVEARPAGKKVKRLSLLSGGERSLTAVALLVAIFKARPSPFYVMDEVEAALDDVNLSRLLTIFEELRESSQLIIITHQKRTMQVADSLYGVTMQNDGVSQVISQRIPR